MTASGKGENYHILSLTIPVLPVHLVREKGGLHPVAGEAKRFQPPMPG